MSDVDEQQKRKLLEEKIRRRVGLEERAFRIVEKLVDGCISEDKLKDAAWMITPDHYADIVEERGISKLCGYPICSKAITSIPKQKYHISVKEKKVFDITERKNFCSNQCYQASKYFQKQIPETPVWEREDVKPPDFTLLSLEKTKGTSGEEMLINPAKVILDELKTLEKFDEQLAQKEDEKKATDIQNNSQQDFTSKLNTKASLPEKKCVRNDDSSDKGQEVHLHAKLETEGGGRSLSTLRTDLKQSKVEELVKKCEHLNVLDSDDDNDDDDESRETSTSITKSQQVDAVSSVSKVSVRIKQADEHVHSEREVLVDEICKGIKSMEMSNTTCQRKAEIIAELVNQHSVKLNTQGMESARSVETPGGHSEKLCSDIPDHHVVTPGDKSTQSDDRDSCSDFSKREISRSSLQNIQISPLDFIKNILVQWKTEATVNLLNQNQSSSLIESNNDRGHDDLQNLPKLEKVRKETKHFNKKVSEFYGWKSKSEDDVQDKTSNEENTEVEAVVPLVDSKSQMVIRRRIVLDRLNRVIPDLLVPLNLSIGDVSTEIRELVSTFRLSSHNITMKPSEWTLLGFVLLKIIAYKDSHVAEAFMHNTCQAYFSALLQRIHISMRQIEQLMSVMTTHHTPS